MAHRSIEALVKLAEHHGVTMPFNPEIEPPVSPVEATLIDILASMQERSSGATAAREAQGRPASTEDLRKARETHPNRPPPPAVGSVTR